jgi:hypothetical protein
VIPQAVKTKQSLKIIQHGGATTAITNASSEEAYETK